MKNKRVWALGIAIIGITIYLSVGVVLAYEDIELRNDTLKNLQWSVELNEDYYDITPIDESEYFIAEIYDGDYIMDADGKAVNGTRYSELENAAEGLLICHDDDNVGLLDIEGNIILPCEHREVEYLGGDYIGTHTGQYIKVLDLKGEEIYSMVCPGNHCQYAGGKYFVNYALTGLSIIDLEKGEKVKWIEGFQTIYLLEDGRWYVDTTDNGYGISGVLSEEQEKICEEMRVNFKGAFLDENFNVLSSVDEPWKPSDNEQAEGNVQNNNPQSDFKVRKGDSSLKGIVDSSGKWIIAPVFDDVKLSYDGRYAAVSINELSGIVDLREERD